MIILKCMAKGYLCLWVGLNQLQSIFKKNVEVVPNILSSKYKNLIFILYLKGFFKDSEFFSMWLIFHLGEHYPI